MKGSKALLNLRSQNTLNITPDLQMALAARVGLTVPELREVQDAAHETYQIIGGDLHNASGTMKRFDVIECTLDCGNVQTYVGRRLSPKIQEWFKTMGLQYPLAHIYEAVAPAFPYSVYE